MTLTVAIPTFNRDQVLLETLQEVMALEPPALEILVLDQTERHEESVHRALSEWHFQGMIRWFQLPSPSVTKAMNRALIEAHSPFVLFLDDDVIPVSDLVSAHLTALGRDSVGAVAGRVLQPWDDENETLKAGSSKFSGDRPAWVQEFIGCNFSVRREAALSIGGFDENFVRVGYRYEAEFAYRLLRANYKIYFEPTACINHLKVHSGGTRTFGNHLRSFRPDHSVGAYYYHLRTWSGWPSFAALLSRAPQAIVNRHHLQRPWWIPATVTAEVLGMIWALILVRRGPRYLQRDPRGTEVG